MVKVKIEELKKIAPTLKAGDEVRLYGTVYTARDAVHKKFAAMLEAGESLPIDLEGAVIYYAGPTPAREGMAVGSCGPTTSSRMDIFTPMLLERGLSGIIGKGGRNRAVVESLVENGAVYFCAVGGAGALYADRIKKVEVIAFEELGCESLKKMEVEDFPVFVGIDCEGRSLFEREGT